MIQTNQLNMDSLSLGWMPRRTRGIHFVVVAIGNCQPQIGCANMRIESLFPCLTLPISPFQDTKHGRMGGKSAERVAECWRQTDRAGVKAHFRDGPCAHDSDYCEL
jgi:hypothetical protein